MGSCPPVCKLGAATGASVAAGLLYWSFLWLIRGGEWSVVKAMLASVLQALAKVSSCVPVICTSCRLTEVLTIDLRVLRDIKIPSWSRPGNRTRFQRAEASAHCRL